MKKILVITPFFYPHMGGSEKYMENLYAFIKKRDPEITVDVLCYNTEKTKTEERYKGLNIFRIPCHILLQDQFCLPNPLSLVRFLQKKGDQYDLIHCSTRFFDSSWWAPFYAKLKGKKIILTDHCSDHPVHKNPLVSLIAKLADLTIVNLSLHLYDKVYTQNIKTQNFLKKTFGISSDLAYPGLEPNLYKRQESGKLKIVFVGRLIESKGVKNLFDIALSLPQVDFTFAGPGELDLDFRQRIAREEIKNIKITGSLSEKEVQKLLAQSDIFAYPSMHSEGLPLALIEAGANGLAVAAMDSGAISELIKDNKTGLLVKSHDKKAFKDALDRLIGDKSLRQKLAKNLHDYTIKNFSWKKAAELVIGEL